MYGPKIENKDGEKDGEREKVYTGRKKTLRCVWQIAIPLLPITPSEVFALYPYMEYLPLHTYPAVKHAIRQDAMERLCLKERWRCGVRKAQVLMIFRTCDCVLGVGNREGEMLIGVTWFWGKFVLAMMTG